MHTQRQKEGLLCKQLQQAELAWTFKHLLVVEARGGGARVACEPCRLSNVPVAIRYNYSWDSLW
jgi:hypothetical protein